MMLPARFIILENTSSEGWVVVSVVLIVRCSRLISDLVADPNQTVINSVTVTCGRLNLTKEVQPLLGFFSLESM